jgi:hypothetical protein
MNGRVLPRVGYAAMGLVYMTIGIIAAGYVPARGTPAGMHGALAVLLRQWEGRWVLSGVAAGLTCFAVWRTYQTFSGRGGLIARVGWAITAIGYAALAWTAASLVLRLPRGEPASRIGIGRLLPYPAGRAALLVAAGILVIVGIVAVVQGITGRLPRWLSGAGFFRAMRPFTLRLARFGLGARGIVAVVMGCLLVRAVADAIPERRVVGGSLRFLSQSPGGPL